jgi:hypothetical protein
MKLMKRVFSLVVSSCIAFGMAGHAFADQDNQAMAPPSAIIQRTPAELQQLVAPIALYPDALVAQILAAATHIAEVVAADRWMQSHSLLQGDELAAQVDQQVWDASVKALTGFPAVLGDMVGLDIIAWRCLPEPATAGDGGHPGDAAASQHGG